MGETCLHVPARVFGFESTVEIASQPQRSPGQLEQRASLLSALLKDSRQPLSQQLPSTFMDTSDASSSDDDEDMHDMEAEEDDVQETEEVLSAAGGSAPMPIPSTSDAFLKGQREALKRFVYAHQIEEMRKQCAAYFTRQARFNEVMATESNISNDHSVPTAPVEASGKGIAVPQPTTRHRLRKPGF